MTADFTPLDVEAIAAAVRHLELRPRIAYLPIVDSTNRVARDLKPGEWRHGTVIFADFQRAGRGRNGRGWEAPAGTSLLLSVVLVLPPRATPAEAIMMASLAASDAVQEVTGLHPTLKWPNDVLLSGKKLCGILAEYVEQAGQRRVILGIGLNVSFDPSSVGIQRTTSLAKEAGRPIGREPTAIALLTRLDLWYRALTEDPDTVFDRWAQSLDTIGSPVEVIQTDGAWHGEAVGVQRDGSLLIRTPEGDIRPVYAADVSVRKRNSFTTS